LAHRDVVPVYAQLADRRAIDHLDPRVAPLLARYVSGFVQLEQSRIDRELFPGADARGERVRREIDRFESHAEQADVDLFDQLTRRVNALDGEIVRRAEESRVG